MQGTAGHEGYVETKGHASHGLREGSCWGCYSSLTLSMAQDATGHVYGCGLVGGVLLVPLNGPG